MNLPRLIMIAALAALMGWLFLVRPAQRRARFADLVARLGEDRCCFEGFVRYPHACRPALDELAELSRGRDAVSDAARAHAAACPAVTERDSHDPAVRLCGWLATAEDREAAAHELGDRLAEAANRPGCHRDGRMLAVRLRAIPSPAEQARAQGWSPPARIWIPPFEATRTDAESAIAACSRRLSECSDVAGRTVDACAVSIPVCQTERFWEEPEVCCLQKCVDTFADARRGGKSPAQAVMSAFWRCSP